MNSAILSIILFWAFCLLPLPSAAQKQDFPSINLANNWVKMKIYLPDKDQGFYRATRFDWSGVIASVQYKDHEYFGYWKDQHDPNIHEDLTGPVEGYIKPGLGYEEAQPGQGFIRIGIGVLEKAEEKEYEAFKTYKIMDHGKWTISNGENWVDFKHEVSSDFGYSYLYTKRIELSENEPGFIISHVLENTGSKKIETDQFNHNFFMIDNEKAGPNLEVSFPYPIKTDHDLKGLMSIHGGKLIFNRNLNSDNIYMELAGYSDQVQDHEFTVINTNTGAGVRVSLDQPVHRMVFWACNTTYCPENFIWISIDPGEKFQWTSQYHLFVN